MREVVVTPRVVTGDQIKMKLTALKIAFGDKRSNVIAIGNNRVDGDDNLEFMNGNGLERFTKMYEEMPKDFIY